MNCKFHPLTIVSSVVLFFGTVEIVIALTTSYWNYYHLQIQMGPTGLRNYNTTKGHRGIIYTCHQGYDFLQGGQTCFSRFKPYQVADGKQAPPNFALITQPQTWEYATLALLSMSAVLGLAALLLAPFFCHKRLCGLIHSVFVYTAGFFALLSMFVYMGFQLHSSMSQDSQWMKFDSFGWSFFICISGVFSQFLAAILYTLAACCCHSKDGYTRGYKSP